MKGKLSTMLAIVLLFAMVLAGCSGSNNGNNGQNNPSHTSNNQGTNEGNAEESTKEGSTDGIGPVTLHIVNGGGSSVDQMMTAFGNALEEKFPEVEFVFKSTTSELKIDKMILAGEPIDIFFRSIGAFFYEVPENGFQYDMTELVETHDVDLSRIDPAIMESMTANANGEIWGIPFTNTNLVLYYNKDIFDSFGVEYPKDGMTWDEMYDLAKQFNQTRDGVDYVGLALSGHHVVKLNNFGMSYVDPNTGLSTYDDERWKHVLDVLYTPAQDPGYQAFMAKKENKVADSQDFYDGKAAMLGTIQHHSGNPNFQRADFNWDMAAFPTYAENPGVGSQAYPEYMAIPSFSEHKDEAMEVIKYLISDEFQTELSKKGAMTVLADPEIQAVYGTGEYQGKNLEAAFYNEFAPVMVKTVYDNEVERAVTQYVNDLALGKIDINTALRQAKEQGDQKIAEMSAK
ncbi:ABC transporter substrate-binding protein [Marinicrinis lubricantis]|uniref:ABC transporter substrate-binding protein n=1 Tax=Marinicrinis lubricantis TaxID=2086470 RepID=A0ABW1IVG6_9BACL